MILKQGNKIITTLTGKIYIENILYPVIIGAKYVGSDIDAGVNRPNVSTSLLNSGTGYVNMNPGDDFNFELQDYNYYNWFAILGTESSNDKNFWYVDEFNNGEIGGDINLGGNLFPEPTIIKHNKREYKVYIANYQTDGIDGITTIEIKQ